MMRAWMRRQRREAPRAKTSTRTRVQSAKTRGKIKGNTKKPERISRSRRVRESWTNRCSRVLPQSLISQSIILRDTDHFIYCRH